MALNDKNDNNYARQLYIKERSRKATTLQRRPTNKSQRRRRQYTCCRCPRIFNQAIRNIRVSGTFIFVFNLSSMYFIILCHVFHYTCF